MQVGEALGTAEEAEQLVNPSSVLNIFSAG